MPAASPRQLPTGAEIYLDHVGHFVADADAAAAALERAGFAPSPVSVQVNPDPAGGAPQPTGTGNVCAMLRAGYVEVLFKTADTPLGREFDAARARYDGLHLVAFAVAEPDTHHARLAAAGFDMQPVVKMQRPVETAAGPGIAAFEVVRVKPGEMREGRVQMLLHRTEETVWQPRWLAHPNGAVGLQGLTIVVADVTEAAKRFARFTARTPEPVDGGSRITLDRGWIELLEPAAWQHRWPAVAAPALPFMGECAITVASLTTAEHLLRDAGFEILAAKAGASRRELAVRFPSELGTGVWTFTEAS